MYTYVYIWVVDVVLTMFSVVVPIVYLVYYTCSSIVVCSMYGVNCIHSLYYTLNTTYTLVYCM